MTNFDLCGFEIGQKIPGGLCAVWCAVPFFHIDPRRSSCTSYVPGRAQNCFPLGPPSGRLLLVPCLFADNLIIHYFSLHVCFCRRRGLRLSYIYLVAALRYTNTFIIQQHKNFSYTPQQKNIIWLSDFDSNVLDVYTLHFIEWWLLMRVLLGMENFLKL